MNSSAGVLPDPDARPGEEGAIADLADVFGLLGDPGRLRLLITLLRGERRVGDLAAEVGLSESATSHALRILRAHRVVRVRRSGRMAFYALADDHVRTLLQVALAHVRHDVRSAAGAADDRAALMAAAGPLDAGGDGRPSAGGAAEGCRSDAPPRTAGRHVHHAPSVAARDSRYLAAAAVLIGAFLVGELVAAVLGHSLVLFADAGHMSSDVAALALSVWAARLTARPPSAVWTYGLRRAEILSAAINGVTLVVVAVVITIEAVRRLVTPAPVSGGVVLAVALVGAAVNVLAAAALRRADRSSMNVRGAVAHVVTDLYAFAGSGVAAIVIITTGWRRADAVASLAVVALMLGAAYPLLRDAGRVLLEASPEGVDLAEVRAHLVGVDHVLDVHDLHAWTVASGLPTLSAHVVVTDQCFRSGHAPQILDSLQECLAGHFDLTHATFQLEPASHAAHEDGAHP